MYEIRSPLNVAFAASQIILGSIEGSLFPLIKFNIQTRMVDLNLFIFKKRRIKSPSLRDKIFLIALDR